MKRVHNNIILHLLIAIMAEVFLSSCSHIAPQNRRPNASSIKVAWSKNLDPYYESGNLAIGLGAPRIFNDIVYMGSLKGVMRAYDLETGRELWRENEKTPLGAPAELVQDHIVYGGQSGRLFSRHYLTGKLKYAIDLGSPIESAPYFYDGRLYLYLRGHQIVSLDPLSGKILWVFKRSVALTTTLQRTTKPLIIKGSLGAKMIVGFADGYVGALSLNDGSLIWETKISDQGKFLDIDLNPLKFGHLVVTGSPSSELKALDEKTGSIIKNFNLVVEAHPLKRNQHLILGTTSGEIIELDQEGKIVQKKKISSKPISALTLWNKTLVAASFDGALYFLNAKSFFIEEKFFLGNEVSAIYSDIVSNGDHLAVYSSRNRLYVFHNKN